MSDMSLAQPSHDVARSDETQLAVPNVYSTIIPLPDIDGGTPPAPTYNCLFTVIRAVGIHSKLGEPRLAARSSVDSRWSWGVA